MYGCIHFVVFHSDCKFFLEKCCQAENTSSNTIVNTYSHSKCGRMRGIMEHIIQVEHLWKKYTTYKRGSGLIDALKSFFHREKIMVNAVKDISFTVEKGEIIGILGPNGAGKSTTIKMLTGTLYPSEGNIDIMGYNPSKQRKAYVKEIGAVFGQKSQLIYDIPAVDSFRMNKAIYGIPDQEYEKRLNFFAELLDVKEIMLRPTRVLSLGERMKCEFIMAMLHNPKIIFLDEPTIGLDVIAKQKIREFIREMNQKGTTFILTTHDLQDVEELAKKVIIINKGEKVFDDTIEHLRTTLGDIKIIELTFAKEYVGLEKYFDKPDAYIPGATLTQGEDACHLGLQIDMKKTNITDIMKELANRFEFTDISIKSMPMEQIITHIYKDA